MYRIRTTKLSKLLAESKDRKGICIQLLLTWLMSADGNVTDKELDFFDDAAPPAGDESYLEEFLFMCEDGKYLEIQLACEYLRRHLSQRNAREFVRLAIGMILADGRFTYMERYILELYCDMFEISHEELCQLFHDVKGVDLPELGNPGAKEWWVRHERDYLRRRERRRAQTQSGYPVATAADRRAAIQARAYAILGLPQGASREDVRMTFRRLAQIHHPDRFHRLGPEAMQVATETFNRIKRAHDYLLNE
ncbi:hypothetical protein BVY04_03590 [bacterium M21]|nr:hypothetical protein BVY04_03590 [bacterium M21]